MSFQPCLLHVEHNGGALNGCLVCVVCVGRGDWQVKDVR